MAFDLSTVLFVIALAWIAVFNIMLLWFGWRRVPPERRFYLLMIAIGLYGLWLVALFNHLLTGAAKTW